MKSADTNPLTVLGLAMGFEERGLSAQHEAMLACADHICGFPATLALLKKLPQTQTLIHKLLPLTLPLAACMSDLEEKRSQGQKIVCVAGGDPLFYGLGSTLTRYFPPEMLQILPAPSSLQLACARLALPVHEVDVLSLHGRQATIALSQALLTQKHLCLLLDDQHTAAFVARFLLLKGCHNYRLHIFCDLGRSRERAWHLSPEEARELELTGSVTVILECTEKHPRPYLGLEQEDIVDNMGYASSLSVRATALALLAVQPEDTIWDIGSGSGAVALEAASLARQGAVYAVEAQSDRASTIVRRAQKLGACHLEVIQGSAPDCLEDLPAPHKIFVGGGLSQDHGQKLLTALCQRLQPGGRLVISCVLFSTFQTCLNTLKTLRWPLRILQVQSSQARPLAHDLHFQAENPVFLLCAQRKA